MQPRAFPHAAHGTPPETGLAAIEPFRPPHRRRTFRNPILPAPAQDPQVLEHEGVYHYCESTAEGISLRSSASFVDLRNAPRRRLWSPPRRGPVSRNLWAPELHRLDGRCYIYFAADDGHNAHHRLWVLAGGTDPRGPYVLAGQLETGGWAIDGTVLCRGHARYLIWSGWPGERDGQQNLYAARLENPLALAGTRVLLATPDQPWERRGLPICEAPQILERNGRTFIVYSASGSWTEHYCLGLLALVADDPLDPQAWVKSGPVFRQNRHAWGVGHCGFVKSPAGEDWMLYHAKTSRRPGWNDREVRAQRFGWSRTGEPLFGEPVSRSLAQPRPALDLAPLARSA